MGWYGAANKYRISGKHSFNSGTGLGLHRSSQIPSAAPQDGKAYGAQGSDSRMPAWEAMVFPALGLGRSAAHRCKLFIEGQQGCAATLL
jgi:hypothetical protein